MAKYVQYLNVGFGIFNNIREVKEWNVDVATEEALVLENEEQDIRIVGFRFFEKEEELDQISSESGIYYLKGEVINNPSDDGQIVSYYEYRRQPLPKVPLVKIQSPFFLLYPYGEEDQFVDTHLAKEKIALRKKQARIATLRQEISDYKQSVVQEIRKIADAMEEEEFLLVPLTKETGEEQQYLDILGDHGNFKKHISYLEEKIAEITKLQLPDM